MPDAVLALNAGSSSLKFALFGDAAGMPELMLRGELEGADAQPHLTARDAGGRVLLDRSVAPGAAAGQASLLGDLLDWIDHRLGGERLGAVGHRVVHGGEAFGAPVRVTPQVLTDIEALTPLAPLHQPHSVAPIRAVAALRPDLPQVACFDTAFHRTMPPVATRLAIPHELGLRRFGFHGLSYEFISGRLRQIDPRLAGGRVVVAHLGSGASLCALSNAVSIDTTMGFSALDGLMMGTRPGEIDAGVLLYLLQQRRLSPHELETLLYRKSGLLGVSGISADMRVLRASGEPRAREAIELFGFRVAQQTAAMACSLGGLDGFVFTGGIGEHDAALRAEICARLAWLGVACLDPVPAAHATRISTAGSRVEVHVIATDEEAMIARHTRQTLA